MDPQTTMEERFGKCPCARARAIIRKMGGADPSVSGGRAHTVYRAAEDGARMRDL